MLCFFLGFVSTQLVGAWLILLGILNWNHPPVRLAVLLLAAALLVLDYQAFHKMFLTARQEDKVADAIARIADGDTSYQMELSDLSGKELQIAHKINRIGIGLEHALQEQVKSERLKADLITNVSHDLKTPLTSIINYVDLITREHIQNPKLQE